jgi:hypothetical protein
MGSQVVIIARRRRDNPHAILYFESTASSPISHDFALLHDPVPVIVESEGAPSEVVAFKAFDSTDRVSEVRVLDENGVQTVLVTPRPDGFEQGGADIDLPLLPASATPEQAINQMKTFDRRAIIVAYDFADYQLLMNYEIARAYLDRSTLVSMRGLGHPVSIREGRPTPRMRLFTTKQPAGQTLIRITSLFESVGGIVANAGKICVCSGRKKEHTVVDASPSLDQSPCSKAPLGHGTLSCF